jgi:hypothetical protein
MNKYFVLFNIPSASMQTWVANTDEATRKEQTEKLMTDWQTWMTEHADAILDKGLPLGKTKRVDAKGVTDTKNDVNWYLLVQAESHDAAAQMFVNHPHLVQIPSAYVEIMDATRVGM